MSKEIITKEDLMTWLERPLTDDDLDLCEYLSNAVQNRQKYYEENQKLKSQLELYDNGVIYDSRVDKLESVLDEIREYIEEKLALFPKGLVTKHLEKDYLEDLLQILDKVKE